MHKSVGYCNMKKDLVRQSSDFDGIKDYDGPQRDRDLLHKDKHSESWHRNRMLCMRSFNARACNSINGSSDGTYERSDDLHLTDVMCRELTKRFTQRNKGLLCRSCAECLRGVMQPPLMLVRGILLLIRRDCGRDFSVQWEQDVLDLTAV